MATQDSEALLKDALIREMMSQLQQQARDIEALRADVALLRRAQETYETRAAHVEYACEEPWSQAISPSGTFIPTPSLKPLVVSMTLTTTSLLQITFCAHIAATNPKNVLHFRFAVESVTDSDDVGEEIENCAPNPLCRSGEGSGAAWGLARTAEGVHGFQNISFAGCSRPLPPGRYRVRLLTWHGAGTMNGGLLCVVAMPAVSSSVSANLTPLQASSAPAS